MPNREPPRGQPQDILRRVAELESQMPRVLAELHEQVRRCRELCRQSEGLREQSEAQRRAVEESLARP